MAAKPGSLSAAMPRNQKQPRPTFEGSMNKRKRPPRLPEFKTWVGASPRAQKKAMLTKRSKKVKITLAQLRPSAE